MRIYIYIIFTFLPLSLFSQTYTLSVIKPKTLTVAAQQEYENLTLNHILKEIGKNRDYTLTDDKTVTKILEKNNIVIDSLMLDEDLSRICRILKSDIVIYPLISSLDASIISYIKIVTSEEKSLTFQKLFDSKSETFQNDYLSFTSEAVAGIRPVLPYKKPVLTPFQITGIILLSTGLTATVTGGIFYLIDLNYFTKRVVDARNAYLKRDGSVTYETYLQYYNENLYFFVASSVMTGTGILLSLASIPFLAYKPAAKKMSIRFQFTPDPEISISFRF